MLTLFNALSSPEKWALEWSEIQRGLGEGGRVKGAPGPGGGGEVTPGRDYAKAILSSLLLYLTERQ